MTMNNKTNETVLTDAEVQAIVEETMARPATRNVLDAQDPQAEMKETEARLVARQEAAKLAAENPVARPSGKKKKGPKVSKRAQVVAAPQGQFTKRSIASALGISDLAAYGLIQALTGAKLAKVSGTRKTSAGKGKPENLYTLTEGVEGLEKLKKIFA